MNHRPSSPRLLLATAVAVLAGCASAPDPTPPAPPVAQWHAPLPHGGEPAALRDWWSRFDDPLLPALVAEAQQRNPSQQQALARVTQARAQLRASSAALWPTLGLQASVQRQRTELPPPAASTTTSVLGGQASWEIDLFGGVRHGLAAARARADVSSLAWHDARVSLAADTALTYVGLRTCEALLGLYVQDAQSQARSAELTQRKAGVGFEAPAVASLAVASAAEATNRAVAQRAECDVLIKALVALTATDEPVLRERLAPGTGRLPQPAAFDVQAVPAAQLAQRPDIAAAERELRAAAGDVGVADALRYPRLSLAGSISLVGLQAGGATQQGTNWGFGPALDLALFDAGRRAANLEAARARFDEVRAGYELRVRQAVREVEEALVRLDAAARRQADAQRAAEGYQAHFVATQRRWEVGAGSVIEMEDARRLALAAQAGLLAVQRERVAAWVGLYRAMGGGWDGRIEVSKGSE